MSKVLWIGDGGATTGFGTVTHNIGDRLVELGHDVHCLAANYTGDYFPTKVKLYRANSKQERDTIGATRVLELLAEVMPDVVVILNDPHVMTNLLFKNSHDPEKILLRLRPIIGYLAIDGVNYPPAWTELTKFMAPVAMGAFGAQQLPVPAKVIHHGVDHNLFRPISEDRPRVLSNGKEISSKREAKEAFGFDPDGFLVLRVDRNSIRKDFGATWRALVPFMKRHSEAQAYFHTKGNDPAGGPIFPAMWTRDMDTIERFQLPSDESYNTFRGWPDVDLAGLYNAADLFVSTSMGEGFGLTLAEALASEIPVVAQKCSAIPEVVGPGGVLVDPGPVVTAPAGHDLRVADVPAFTRAIEKLYQNPDRRAELGRAGRRHVIESFDWDEKAQQFSELIVQIHEASLESGKDPKQAVEEAVASIV